MSQILTESRTHEKLSQFAGKKYLGIETYRGNGQAVFTPVWFAADNGHLYVLTDGHSGKAKRIRKNQHVRVVATTARGKPESEWFDGEARIGQGPTIDQVKKMMDEKYGLMDKLMARLYRLITRRHEAGVVVSIRVKEVNTS